MPSTHPAARRRGPGADGFPGIAAICRAYGVNASLLGGGDADEAAATAEEAVELARRSGMPTAIVLTLNSLAMSLVERDPVRARAVLGESLDRTIGMGEDLWGGLLTACMVAGRLRDWELTRTLVARSLYFDRWFMAPLQIAICLAECARAFADDRPEVAAPYWVRRTSPSNGQRPDRTTLPLPVRAPISSSDTFMRLRTSSRLPSATSRCVNFERPGRT